MIYSSALDTPITKGFQAGVCKTSYSGSNPLETSHIPYKPLV